MTIYQKELARKLPILDCTGTMNEDSGQLHVWMDHMPLCTAGKKADLNWEEKNLFNAERKAVHESLCEAAAIIREYVSLYEASLPMKMEGLKEYRRMAEYRDVVLGGMFSEQHGFMFSTWRQNINDRSYVTNGDYSPNYEYIKKSFAVRSGLINKQRLFTEEEAADLYRCLRFVQDHCDPLTYDQDQQLRSLAEKLVDGYPEIENNSPSFETKDIPQWNL